jgi:hypothetical protein
LEFEKLKADRNALVEKSLILEAVAAAQSLSKGEVPQWPTGIPSFSEAKEGDQAKAVRVLYAMAVAWAILHEMQHAKFYENADKPNEPIDEEIQCDEYAADFLLGKIEKYFELTGEPVDHVRGKRAMSALVGLYYIAKLSPENSVSETHPPIQMRIRLLFDRIGSQPAIHFWGFATALICGLNPDIASTPISEVVVSSRDLASVALDKAFK